MSNRKQADESGHDLSYRSPSPRTVHSYLAPRGIGGYPVQTHHQQTNPGTASQRHLFLPMFPQYDQFNPENRRDDDDTATDGFEVTRERVMLSDKSMAYQPTPHSPPPPSILREITQNEFRTSMGNADAGPSNASTSTSRGEAMSFQNSTDAQIDNARVDAVHVRGVKVERARIDRMTGARVFSFVVGTAFEGKDVTATMRTELDGSRNIRYCCHEHGVDMKAGDFAWSSDALEFNGDPGDEDGRGVQLNDYTAKSFMASMDDEVEDEWA